MNNTKIIIVNENDEIIGYKERGTLNHGDIYRVSALWIQNSKGDVLLSKRALTKKHDPGKWGPAVAGTNDEGETYESNIMREAEEEVGLKNHHFQKSQKVRRRGEYNYFCQWYLTIVDKELNDFTMQEEEVKEIRWFTRKELLSRLEKNPDRFLKSVKYGINFFNK
ncbi:MAG: NUDIX domain-containing protein [Nanoarchaeota archaeon]|nr:NUDIX domain-containing protein [DPANN group archaeon]MBL7116901.1 NUDIX domain-containing protein [Nanoarchaeota archaeon]